MAEHKFDPFEHGIYRRFRDAAGLLNPIAWNRAVEGGEHGEMPDGWWAQRTQKAN